MEWKMEMMSVTKSDLITITTYRCVYLFMIDFSFVSPCVCVSPEHVGVGGEAANGNT